MLALNGQRRYIKERNETRMNLVRILNLVDETPALTWEDANTIRAVIRPYLKEQIDALPEKPKSTVNRDGELTVNSVRAIRGEPDSERTEDAVPSAC